MVTFHEKDNSATRIVSTRIVQLAYIPEAMRIKISKDETISHRLVKF